MHSHCALCTVTVPEKFFWINLEAKGVVRWAWPACQLVAVEADFLVVIPAFPIVCPCYLFIFKENARLTINWVQIVRICDINTLLQLINKY